MKYPYETMVVFDGSLGEETLTKEKKSFESFLKDNSDFVGMDEIGRKPLAYEIKKKKSGFYCLYSFDAEGSVPSMISGEFEHNDNVLRFLTVRRETKPIHITKEVKPGDSDNGEDQEKKGDENNG